MRFERVFDDEIDMDNAHVDIVLKAAAPDGIPAAAVWNNSDESFALTVRTENTGAVMTFTKLPMEYHQRKMRLTLTGVCLRLPSVQENKPIAIRGNAFPKERNQSVTITVVPQETTKVQKELRPLFVRYTRYLAAAVLIVVAGGVIYENLHRHEDKPTAVDQKIETPADSLDRVNKTNLTDIKKEPEIKKIPQTVTTPLLADHYKPNDVLETFVDRHYRSAAVEVISPGNTDTLLSPIVFKWKETEAAQAFTVIVVDNKNDEVWRGTTKGFSVTFDHKLKPGLYYWMLKSDGDMLSVGKFFVR